MKFDNVTTAKCNVFSPCNADGSSNGGNTNLNCADPDYRATHLGECGDDERCSDPLFAAANPTLCLNTTRLIVKPSAAVVEVLQGVQYVAFLVTGGVETELTEGVVWSVDDISIALIGAGSGNATGVAVGITSVFATYGALTAAAQIEVIADGACAERENHFLLLCDVSKSSGAGFSPAFNTRLDFAKEVLENFVVNGNLARDDYALLKFSTSATEVQAFTQDQQELLDAIATLATLQEQTSLSQTLTDARDYFTAQGVSSVGRVIVLLTDGENNTGVDPLPIAQELRDSGIILIVVALRAKYTPFRMLERMASGGFFVNALKSNYTDVPEWVSGMRQYLCSGNCVPIGDVTLGVGQLNFGGFINWDVTVGVVDLIGQNDGGPPLFDLLPGNGLYVDLCGSGGGEPSNLGTIRTKRDIAVTAGNECTLTVAIAGNQRQNRTPDVVRVSSFDQDNNLIEDLSISVTNFAQLFTDYEIDFTVPGGVTGVSIEIKQESVPSGGSQVFGNLLDNVRLFDVTEDEMLFEDNFDADNPTYVPPACGYGESEGGYGYGYDCYNTCLDGVIPEQIPDTSPLPNLEGESDPVVYTSTKSAIACCPDELTNCAERVATAESDISQADADQKAYVEALALAEAALTC